MNFICPKCKSKNLTKVRGYPFVYDIQCKNCWYEGMIKDFDPPINISRINCKRILNKTTKNGKKNFSIEEIQDKEDSSYNSFSLKVAFTDFQKSKGFAEQNFFLRDKDEIWTLLELLREFLYE